MHFINLLGENDSEIVILTHQIKGVLIDIILPRLEILKIVVVGLGTAHNFPIEIPGEACSIAVHNLILCNFSLIRIGR